MTKTALNPCFVGIWSCSLTDEEVKSIRTTALNPCFVGIWSCSLDVDAVLSE